MQLTHSAESSESSKSDYQELAWIDTPRAANRLKSMKRWLGEQVKYEDTTVGDSCQLFTQLSALQVLTCCYTHQRGHKYDKESQKNRHHVKTN